MDSDNETDDGRGETVDVLPWNDGVTTMYDSWEKTYDTHLEYEEAG
jgi:hypothetical protein